GSCAKFPCGGGVGVCQSSVVARQGLAPTFLPWLMLQNKMMMNGICAMPRRTAAHKITPFNCITLPGKASMAYGTFAIEYSSPPLLMRRNMPLMPCTNIGMNTMFMKANEHQKCTRPQNSFIFRPVIFGNQKYTPAKSAKIVPGATT